MAHMYTEAQHKLGLRTRVERFSYSAEKMGLTIIGGAITTAGSGSMMFLCQMVFFFKMGVLITVTILFSTVFSLGAFMSLCVLVGPENDFGDTALCVRRLLGKERKDGHTAEAKNMDTATVGPEPEVEMTTYVKKSDEDVVSM